MIIKFPVLRLPVAFLLAARRARFSLAAEGLNEQLSFVPVPAPTFSFFLEFPVLATCQGPWAEQVLVSLSTDRDLSLSFMQQGS